MSWRLRIFLWMLHRKPEQVPILDILEYRVKAEQNWKTYRSWIDGRLVPVAESLDQIISNRNGDPIRVRSYKSHHPNDRTMFYLHGGGWVGRDLDTYDNFCRRVCQNTNTTVYSIEYRKSPETPFPGAIEDCIDVIQNLVQTKEIDSEKLILCGDSAGGNMAISITFLLQHTIRFQKLLIFYPPLSTDFNFPSFQKYGRGYIIENEIIAWMRDQYLPSKKLYTNALASPLLHENFDFLPRTLITTGGKDPLQDHAMIFRDKLYQAGVPVLFHKYSDLPHGYYLMYNLSRSVRTAYEDVYEFIS